MSTSWPVVSMVAISLLQVLGVVLGGPLLLGLMRKVRCRLEGRVGPPVHQPLLDLRKLARRERTRPEQASWIFPLAPLVLVGTTLVIAVIAPLLATDPAFGWSADLFAIVYLLLLGSVALAVGALDTGTAFGGMGASRAMTIGALAEPALLVAVLALSVPARSSNVPTIITRSLAHPLWLATPGRLLALVAFMIVIVAEGGRLPVDNPSTHLELTMIHEAMVLEYAGPDLALVKLGESMRLAVLFALFADLFVPWGIATAPGAGHLALGLVATVAKVAVLGVGLAAFEVAVAKLRLFRVPELMAGAFSSQCSPSSQRWWCHERLVVVLLDPDARSRCGARLRGHGGLAELDPLGDPRRRGPGLRPRRRRHGPRRPPGRCRPDGHGGGRARRQRRGGADPPGQSWR